MEPFVHINHSPESTPSIGSDEGDSFVVLGRDLDDHQSPEPVAEVLPSLRTNKIHEIQNLLEMHILQINADPMPVPSISGNGFEALSTSGLLPISPDTSIEEIQKQVEELIKENEKLKDVIAQNNLSMRSQNDRFLAYRDQVTNAMKVNKDRFNEAKLCIDKCKEENIKYANEIEVYVNIKKLQEEEIISLKDKLKQYENSHVVNELKFDPKAATDEIGILQNALAEVNVKSAQLKAENDRLTTKLMNSPKLEDDLSLKRSEIDDLKSQIAKLQSENVNITKEAGFHNNKNAELDLALKRAIAEGNQQHEAQAAAFKNQLKFKEEAIASLEVDVQLGNKKLRDLQDKYDPLVTEQCVQLREQLSVAQKTITALEQAEEEQIRQIENLRELLQESNEKADDIYALKEQINMYKSDFEAEKQEKDAVKQQKEQIAEDLKNVQQRITKLQKEVEMSNMKVVDTHELTEQVNFYKGSYETEKESKEAIRQQMEQIAEDLKNIQRRNTQLQREVERNHEMDSDIHMLKRQIHFYKSDLEAEKASKDAIKHQKDQIAEDLKNVQQHNTQLQKEVERLGCHLRAERNDAFVCPKCTIAFSSYQSLENHIDGCLDLDGFP